MNQFGGYCMLWRIIVALVSGLALAMTLSTSARAQTGVEPRVALVVGNAAYSDSFGKLANPVNDATKVAAALRAAGFDVDLVVNVDQRALKQAISRFGMRLGRAGSQATGLFYYAGHGVQSRGNNYLIPVNAAFSNEADLDLDAVDAGAVLSQMQSAGMSTSIVILDACRNMPLARSFRSGTRGLARMDAPNGSYIAYSTAPGQTAVDGTSDNSPFAAAFVREIQQPGQSIDAVFTNIRRSVAQATGGTQVPWSSSSLLDSFIFRASGGTSVGAAQPPAMTGVGANVPPVTTVPRGYIGVAIQPVTEEIAAALGLGKDQGEIIASVAPGQPAAKAGVNPGDVVLKVDGESVTFERTLASMIASKVPGSQARLELLRDGRPLSLMVTTTTRPTEDAIAAAATTTATPPAGTGASPTAPGSYSGKVDALGVTWVQLTPAIASSLGLGTAKGIVISQVDPASDIAQKGLQRGDLIVSINNVPVTTEADVNQAIATAKNSGRGSVLLSVQRRGDRRYVGVKLK